MMARQTCAATLALKVNAKAPAAYQPTPFRLLGHQGAPAAYWRSKGLIRAFRPMFSA